MLLYPGSYSENQFKSYLKDDYSNVHEDNHREIDHQCKTEFVSTLDENGALMMSLVMTC